MMSEPVNSEKVFHPVDYRTLRVTVFLGFYPNFKGILFFNGV